MADATTAAKERLDRALAELERKAHAVKAAASTSEDVDLFAPRPGDSRVVELEAAAADASAALAAAAEEVRAILAAAEGRG